MAVTLTGVFRIFIDVYEKVAADLGAAVARHTLDYNANIASGTGSGQADVVFSDKRTAAAAADDLDLRGVLASSLNTAIQFVRVTGIIIRNKSNTTGHVLTIGGDAAAFFAGMFGAATERIKVQPGGAFAWYAPGAAADVGATTNTTADILQVDPGANTIEYEIVILGRTA